MTRSDRRLRGKLTVLGLVLTLLALGLEQSTALEPMENWLYDKRARLCQYFTPPPSPLICHLDIDDAALDAVGRWPWPRAQLAEMMDEVRTAGPRAVALDILFIDPARDEWEPQPLPDGGTAFVQTRPDERFAESLRQAGNALVPVHLDIRNPDPVSALQRSIQGILIKDLELNEAQVSARVGPPGGAPLGAKPPPATGPAATGPPATGPATTGPATAPAEPEGADTGMSRQLEEAFLPARRDAARQRVAQEWDAISAEVSAGPGARAGATSQPSTLPAGGPAAARPVSDDPVEDRIVRRLLPHTDLTINSPLLRTVLEACERVRAARAVRRFGYPIPPQLPTLYRPGVRDFPVPVLSDAAAATAFVDYPVFQDGVVRAVPLFVQSDGRMYPQMGLMLASMMLGVSPKDFRCAPDSVTIPVAGRPDGKGGTYARDIVIPVSTLVSPNLDQPLATYFHIPWVGGRNWAAMYDQAHPDLRKQHLSITRVWDVVQALHRVEHNNLQIDRALRPIVDATGEASLKAFIDHPPPADDSRARRQIVDSTLRLLGDLGLPLDKSPEDPSVVDESARILLRAARALRELLRENQVLATGLEQDRQFLRSRLNGKGVLVGSIATASDEKATSIHPQAPGVIIHGTIANAILTNHLWREAPPWAGVLATLAAGMMTTLIVAWLPPARAWAASASLAAGYLLFNGLVLFDYGGVLLGAAGPMAAVILVWSGGTLVRLVVEGLERARITRRFRSYVDPSLVDYVLEHPEQNVFTGEVREMTVVFTDLAGFTAVSEKLGREIIPLLNELMGMISAVVKKHSGFVNKFMGDGVMFFFNAPETNPHHARDALAAVLDIHAALDEFDERMIKRGLPVVSLRAGITTGTMVVGDAGTADRSDYTVLGDNVNLASRLESANKATGTDTLVIDRTVEMGGQGFFCRPVGRICVVGQTIPVMTYHVMCRAGEETEEQKRLAAMTTEMVESFLDARPADCLEAVAKMEEAFGESKLTHLYREKCISYLQQPTPGEFDCQIVLTQK